MGFTHAGKHGLFGLRVLLVTKGRILFQKTVDSIAQLILIAFSTRHDSHHQSWLREINTIKNDAAIFSGQGITSDGISQLAYCGDITQVDFR